MLTPYVHDTRIRLLSLMDHTPGQRQWTNLERYRSYVMGKRGWSSAKFDRMLDLLYERQLRHAAANRQAAIELNRMRLPLASHDDTTGAHVIQAVRDGVSICEFPTTLAAAQAARAQGLAIVMGAPNYVRGGSHSGNVAAHELAKQGLLDILSSDYVPASLLHAAFLLQEDGYSLPQAMATVSLNPAQQLGMHERGQIQPGLQADFLRVRLLEGTPIVLAVWRQGRQII